MSMALEQYGVDHDNLRRQLTQIVSQVHSAYPDLNWHYHIFSTDYFPLNATASAVRGTGPEAEEMLVLMVQGQRPQGEQGAETILSADITRGDGVILAESPRQHITMHHDVDHAVPAAVDSLTHWLADRVPRIERELSLLWDDATL